MKRIVTLLLAAGLVLGATAGTAKATDVKVSGNWQFGFEWLDNNFNKNDKNDTFTALQRLRTKIDIISSENLRGVAFFEIGKQHWGKGGNAGNGGAALGTDGMNIKVRYSYVDWVVPETDLKIRMGLQPWVAPYFTYGTAVFGDAADGAGISTSYQFNDMVGVTLGWVRAENNNSGKQSDALDAFMLTVPVKGDGFKVTPWAMGAVIGKNSLSTNAGGDINDVRAGMLPVITKADAGNYSTSGLKSHGNAWWLGLGGELTMFSPFRLAFDLNYGSMDMGSATSLLPGGKNFDMKRAGWYGSLLAEYKLDMVTPGLYFWYTSGDNSNPYDGSEQMPALKPSWTGTTYGFDRGELDGMDVVGLAPQGTWGIALILKDITFMEKLSHMFEVAYYRGTNDKKMASWVGTPYATYSDPDNSNVGYTYLTTKDWAWEVDFQTKYELYKNLYMMLEMAYIRLDLDRGVWTDAVLNNMDKNAYKVGLYMKYDF